MALALGMNSGSSFDGIDGAIIDIDVGNDGFPTPPKVVAQLSRDWPKPIAQDVLKAFSNDLTIFELTRLNYTTGAVYAELAAELMQHHGVTYQDVDVIGVDGQTIYQEPPNPSLPLPQDKEDCLGKWMNGPYAVGLQIGEPAVIAAHTNVSVVSNFRPSDHALGGTGAPLMQYLDYVLYRKMAPMVTLNIGGIASSTLLPADSREGILGFDTGAGNVMLDFAMNRLYEKPYDADGKVAASGRVNPALMNRLQEHPFFKRTPPRSAWRLDFGADYAASMMNEFSSLLPEDILATFCSYAAWGTATSLKQYILPKADIRTILASGGGARNPTLMRMLAEYLPDTVRLSTSAESAIPVEAKEAVKFATLAFARKRNLATNIPSASGASRYVSMGRMVLAPSDSIVGG